MKNTEIRELERLEAEKSTEPLYVRLDDVLAAIDAEPDTHAVFGKARMDFYSQIDVKKRIRDRILAVVKVEEKDHE